MSQPVIVTSVFGGSYCGKTYWRARMRLMVIACQVRPLRCASPSSFFAKRRTGRSGPQKRDSALGGFRLGFTQPLVVDFQSTPGLGSSVQAHSAVSLHCKILISRS